MDPHLADQIMGPENLQNSLVETQKPGKHQLRKKFAIRFRNKLQLQRHHIQNAPEIQEQSPTVLQVIPGSQFQ